MGWIAPWRDARSCLVFNYFHPGKYRRTNRLKKSPQPLGSGNWGDADPSAIFNGLRILCILKGEPMLLLDNDIYHISVFIYIISGTIIYFNVTEILQWLFLLIHCFLFWWYSLQQWPLIFLECGGTAIKTDGPCCSLYRWKQNFGIKLSEILEYNCKLNLFLMFFLLNVGV